MTLHSTPNSVSRWSFHYLPPAPDFVATELVTTIQHLFRDAFAIEPNERAWSQVGIAERLQKSALIGLAHNEHGEYVGYALYTLPDEPMADGRYLLWEDSIGILQREQGQGLGTKVLTVVRQFVADKEIGWLGGRTQNPTVIRRYAKQAGELFPFTHLYSSAEGHQLMTYLVKHIEEVQGMSSRLDRSTGICSRIYSEGRLGDYEINMKDVEIAKYEHQLLKWGFDRGQGDAVVVVTKLRHK